MSKALKSTLGFILVLTLVACGGNHIDDSTSKKYMKQAEKIIDLLNDGDYKEVHAMFNGKMKKGLPVKDMKELTPIIQGSGNFKEIKETSIKKKDGLYVTVLTAKYSDKNRVYTITLDDDMKVAGLYVK